MKPIDEILNSARAQGCSDVHLTVGKKISIRKNGTLSELERDYSDSEIFNMIISTVSDYMKDNVEQGKDADYTYVNDAGRHRVNVYRETGNLCAAIRIINDHVKSLDELNMPEILKKLCNEPRGMVLLTGPTGSGKSTTLAAMVDYINQNRRCHILTIEDPIEYVYQHKQALIHQREIGMDVENFDEALRSAMREDPDVILVGEMRDYETISSAVTLAETGHLVFSTLHTVGASKTIDRIIDVFPPYKQDQIRTQLSGVINAVVTQQLLPLADGSGRTAVLEIMVATDAIRNMIRENKGPQIDSAIQTGAALGMIPLNAALASAVAKGKVTKETAVKFAADPAEFKRYLGF